MKKVALVTGAAAGIGRAIAMRLARDGIAIGVLDLQQTASQIVADEIAAEGGQALALGGDIAFKDSIVATADALRAAFGPINILVNNAGISDYAPFLEMTEGDWDRIMAVNLKGTAFATQAILPDMIGAGWGRVVNISSSSAQSGARNMAHYSASKGGVVALTKTPAVEFGPHGITCNAVAPRFVMNTVKSEADFAADGMFSESVRAAMTGSGPIRRQGEPEDIAGACAWLVSEEAGYVTGQLIGVNGGRYI